MKHVVIVANGIADEPVAELGGKTPLEAAKVPFMSQLAEEGVVGRVRTIPPGLPIGCDVALMSLLGYDPAYYYTGAGPLEAANWGVELQETEVAFRCQLVTHAEERLLDPTAGGISTAETQGLVTVLNNRLGNARVQFFAGSGCHVVLVVRDPQIASGALKTRCLSPYEAAKRPLKDVWPQGPSGDWLRDLMTHSMELLTAHEINEVRVDLGENPANLLWPWSPGVRPQLPPFTEQCGLDGAVVSTLDLVKGLGRSAGLAAVTIPPPGGLNEAGYLARARYALRVLKKKPFVLIYVEASDETGQYGDLRKKMAAIEKADRLVLGTLRQQLEGEGDLRWLVLSDYAASVVKRRPVEGLVPFVAAGTGLAPQGITKFHEAGAAGSPVVFERGHELLKFFLAGEPGRLQDVGVGPPG